MTNNSRLPSSSVVGYLRVSTADQDLEKNKADIKEQHAKHEVPKSFRALNQERLQAVLGETKVSEHNAATRDMDEMVSGGVQKVGEVKPCLPNPGTTYPIEQVFVRNLQDRRPSPAQESGT